MVDIWHQTCEELSLIRLASRVSSSPLDLNCPCRKHSLPPPLWRSRCGSACIKAGSESTPGMKAECEKYPVMPAVGLGGFMREIDACIPIKEYRIFQKDSGQYSFNEQYKIMIGEY